MLGDDPCRLPPPRGARRPLLTSGGQMHVQGPPKVLVPYPWSPRGSGQTAQVITAPCGAQDVSTGPLSLW